jgi:hypothetical protein
MFPALKVLPRPEPAEGSSEDHKHWLEESEKWTSLRCKCGRGYFCREHGDWISGNEVGAGKAVTGDQQQPGSCPSYHYDGESKSPILWYGTNHGQTLSERHMLVSVMGFKWPLSRPLHL